MGSSTLSKSTYNEYQGQTLKIKSTPHKSNDLGFYCYFIRTNLELKLKLKLYNLFFFKKNLSKKIVFLAISKFKPVGPTIINLELNVKLKEI